MKRRQLIYVPEIDGSTFLLFFWKGEGDRSYSLRGYADPTRFVTVYAESLPHSVSELLEKARWKFPATTHPTTDIAFWKREIDALNERYLSETEDTGKRIADLACGRPVRSNRTEDPEPRFPMLDLEDLVAHPVKGNKGQDLERIFTSPNSEDYVTWNFARLMERSDPQRWWPRVIELARSDGAKVPPGIEHDPPSIALWLRAPAPDGYERLSRERMAGSGNPDWVARAQAPDAVEGKSEVDSVFMGQSYLLFGEAKLGSDVSMSTKYDPERNQIVRNIDVLLEECGARHPMFWMIVKDRDPGRAYVQLMRSYRESLEALMALLPHRTQEEVERVHRTLAMVLWRDLLDALEPEPSDVLEELERRVSQ